MGESQHAQSHSNLVRAPLANTGVFLRSSGGKYKGPKAKRPSALRDAAAIFVAKELALSVEEVHVPTRSSSAGPEMHRGPCLSLALFESRNGGGLFARAVTRDFSCASS